MSRVIPQIARLETFPGLEQVKISPLTNEVVQENIDSTIIKAHETPIAICLIRWGKANTNCQKDTLLLMETVVGRKPLALFRVPSATLLLSRHRCQNWLFLGGISRE